MPHEKILRAYPVLRSGNHWGAFAPPPSEVSSLPADHGEAIRAASRSLFLGTLAGYSVPRLPRARSLRRDGEGSNFNVIVGSCEVDGFLRGQPTNHGTHLDDLHPRRNQFIPFSAPGSYVAGVLIRVLSTANNQWGVNPCNLAAPSRNPLQRGLHWTANPE